MAKVWFLLAVMLSTQQVLISANECSDVESILNCNECFRCGGHWCNDPKEDVHCLQSVNDDWCPGHQEKPLTEGDMDEIGDLLNPRRSQRTVRVDNTDVITIAYKSASKPTVKVSIVNTTQNSEFMTIDDTQCVKGQCKTALEVIPKNTFCSTTGRTSEYVNVTVNIGGLSEEATVRYRIPCACACSEKVERYSRMCNGRGDYSCGVCSCQDGWTGINCDKKICEARRGDVQCTNPARNNVECSGNGICGPCETCECYADRIGSKYFDELNYCADICMTTSECDECLRNPTPGRCSLCHFPLIYQQFNETVLNERDDLNRSVWVMCNETLPDGYHVEYVAMRDERRDTYFMIPPSDITNAAIGGGGVNVTLPIVLGMLALVAAGMATAGYIMWKNRVPPVPLADPMYTNIDAEDSTGENPLYKPPTSSFKNPTYGKW